MDNNSRSANQNTEKLLKSSLDQVLVFLTVQCEELFAEVEPLLMKYATKAETDQAQARFFDTINIILLQQGEIESHFRKEIQYGFDGFLSGQSILYPTPLIEANEGQQLEVVDDDTLEIYLALQSMVGKAHNECYEELYGLGKRLAMIRGGTPLKEEDIPGCPAHLASAFYSAVEGLGLKNEMLLILLFLFGKHVMNNAHSTYDHINNTLVEAGIFPNLKLAPTRSTDYAGPGDTERSSAGPSELDSNLETPRRFTPATSSAEPMPPPSLQEAMETLRSATQDTPSTRETGQMHVAVAKHLFLSINKMLTAQHQQDPSFQNHPEMLPNGDLSTLRDTPALVDALEEIEPRKHEALFQTKDEKGNLLQNIELDTGLIQQVKETLSTEKDKLYKKLDKNTIPTADIDTIELVGLLFEEVLNEELLPNIAKALISHLHTPYLKVAVQDHSFIIDQDHVARKLLNLMVNAGCQWIDEEQLRRGIYYPMQEIVGNIMVGSHEDTSLFDEAYDILLTQIGELEERAKILEERNHEAARGRERLENARLQAKSIIAEQVGEEKLDNVLDRFLHSAWLDRLILMLLRNPKVMTSKEWQEAVKVITAIVRINQAPTNAQVKRWLGANRVGIKHHVKIGLKALGEHHQNSCEALFEFIDNCLTKVPSPVAQSEPAPPPIESEESPPTRVKREHKSQRKERAAIQLSTEEKSLLKTLQNTHFGTWFELTDDLGKTKQLKLSWFSPTTHKYMFVNRFGAQSYVAPIEELARDMHKGTVKILTQPKFSFVDRALKKIHSVLEHALGLQQPSAQGKP